MNLLGPLQGGPPPGAPQMTAQQLQQANELAMMLARQGENTEGTTFTSPWQSVGQVAQALAARSRMGQNAGTQAALNATTQLTPTTAPVNAPGAGGAGAPGAAPGVTTDAPVSQAGSSSAKPFSSDIQQAILKAAQLTGEDPQKLAGFIHIESDGDPRAVTGSYKGLMQISDDEMKEISHGKGNVLNPLDNVMAGAMMMKRNRQEMAQLGIQATPFMEYMAWQQGVGGLKAHLENPNGNAIENMLSTGEGRHRGLGWAHDAITHNGGHPNDTSQQFLGRWYAKFQRLEGGDHGAFQDGDQALALQAPNQSANPLASVPAGGAAGSSATSPAGGVPPTQTAQNLPSGQANVYADPRAMPQRLPAPYTVDQLNKMLRAGMIKPAEAMELYKQMQEHIQPVERPVAGGTITARPGSTAGVYTPGLQTGQTSAGGASAPVYSTVGPQGPGGQAGSVSNLGETLKALGHTGGQIEADVTSQRQEAETLTSLKREGLAAKFQRTNLDSIRQLAERAGYGVSAELMARLNDLGIETANGDASQIYRNITQAFGPSLSGVFGADTHLRSAAEAGIAAVGGLTESPENRKHSLDLMERNLKYRERLGEVAGDTTMSNEEKWGRIYAEKAPEFNLGKSGGTESKGGKTEAAPAGKVRRYNPQTKAFE